VYESFPGWSTPTTGVRDYQMLPEGAQRYVERLSEAIGCEVGIISTGADRMDTVLRGNSRLASWFE
jgi:adenylosuccinate synthase